MTIRRLCSAALLAVAAVLPAAEPVIEPQAAVQGWIAALQRGDVAALPSLGGGEPTASASTSSAASDGQRQRQPRTGLGMLLDGPMRMLPDDQLAQHGGRLFAMALGQMAAVVGPAGAEAPPVASLPEDASPFLAFGPRLVGGMLPSTALAGILASGLESRQLAALDALGLAFNAWAKQGLLADDARHLAAAPAVTAALAALRPPRPAQGQEAQPFDQQAAWAAAWPDLVKACAIYGLDLQAAFASAAVAVESRAEDGSAVVVIAFTAFGGQHLLPVKIKPGADGWTIVADSPAVRWLRGGMQQGGMMPGRGMRVPGRGRGRGAGGEPAPAQPPAPAPAQPPTEF